SSCSWTGPRPMGCPTLATPACPAATTWVATWPGSWPPPWRWWPAWWPSGGEASLRTLTRARPRQGPRPTRSARLWAPPATATAGGRGESAGRALRLGAQLEVADPGLLLPGWHLRRRLRPGDHAQALRPAPRRGGRPPGLLHRLSDAGRLPDPAHGRPGPARPLLAHADRHRAGRRPQLQVLVAHVAGRVGAAAVRPVHAGDVHRHLDPRRSPESRPRGPPL